MCPSLAIEPPEGTGWIHEIKHDGYRTQLVIENQQVRAFSRNGHDWTDRYPAAVMAVCDLPCENAIIDGEMIVQDQEGRSDFDAFCSALARRSDDIVFMAFDLLHLDGRDIRSEPLEDRRARLLDLIGCHDPHCRIQFSEGVEGSGADFFRAVDAMELEGMVSKRKGSRYRSGRTSAWVKVKTFTEDEFVVIGVERGSGGPSCALLARDGADGLTYAGSAFVTLADGDRERFWREVERLGRERSVVEVSSKSAAWVTPELRVRARYLRGEGKLRHATLVCLEPRPSV